jgi:hypothetical protein
MPAVAIENCTWRLWPGWSFGEGGEPTPAGAVPLAVMKLMPAIVPALADALVSVYASPMLLVLVIVNVVLSVEPVVNAAVQLESFGVRSSEPTDAVVTTTALDCAA